ncbi:FMN-binding protein [Pseudonocardia sp. 73-21]|uniref:FMN-binding protein n=1 Tax=Pseudonocardia sp. 73-21 TaxID=1895809 RepID=UPI000960B254|nr:FMN-binding protein [Pseudonocardia sp. 73-21]OJY47724.1 MAG: FMN-binding protein [Pseudonocardia sp. 73-21]
MRRIVLLFLATLATVVLLFGYRTSTSSTMPSTVAVAAPAAAAAPSTGTPSAGTPSTGTPAAGTTTVTGTTASTRWGPVQVQLTVAGKKITAVDVVQYPNGNGRDQEINSYAIPTLVQETLSAQSANIDMVSGATVTSDGYLTSLQSALDQAGIA